jgi:hypothetical protein
VDFMKKLEERLIKALGESSFSNGDDTAKAKIIIAECGKICEEEVCRQEKHTTETRRISEEARRSLDELISNIGVLTTNLKTQKDASNMLIEKAANAKKVIDDLNDFLRKYFK